jgi:hypothetical protein
MILIKVNRKKEQPEEQKAKSHEPARFLFFISCSHKIEIITAADNTGPAWPPQELTYRCLYHPAIGYYLLDTNFFFYFIGLNVHRELSSVSSKSSP